MILFYAKLTNGWLSLNGIASDSCRKVGFPKTQTFTKLLVPYAVNIITRSCWPSNSNSNDTNTNTHSNNNHSKQNNNNNNNNDNHSNDNNNDNNDSNSSNTT